MSETEIDEDRPVKWVVKYDNGRSLKIWATYEQVEERAQHYADRLKGPFDRRIEVVQWTRLDQFK